MGFAGYTFKAINPLSHSFKFIIIHERIGNIIMEQEQLLKELKQLIEKGLETESRIKIDKIILFGSRAYGKAQKDSDYDILIIVKGPYDWHIKNKIYNLCYEMDLKYDLVTDIKIISVDELNTIKGKQPYIINALEQGITV